LYRSSRWISELLVNESLRSERLDRSRRSTLIKQAISVCVDDSTVLFTAPSTIPIKGRSLEEKTSPVNQYVLGMKR
jgi:hypothetical protein